MSKSETAPLLYFPDVDHRSPVVEVSDRARICVEGNTFYAWSLDDPTIRVTGGSITIFGHTEHVADTLRRCIPADDVRWATSIPEPFFSTI